MWDVVGTMSDVAGSVRVGVVGRVGAGRRTVTRALRGAGVTASPDAVDADVDVYVFVESLNADDLAALASTKRPTVAVLNKADLAGFHGHGPMAVAAERCRELRRATAVPVRPLSALLAVAGTDAAVLDPALRAIRMLDTAPARVPDGARRLLATHLDLFGTAAAVSAIRSGARPAQVAGLLRTLSGLDEVCAEIDRAAAVLRYRRLCSMQPAAPDDDATLARMTAAVAVVRAAGAPDVSGSTRADQLRRAVHWQRYARGPVSALHRACAMDIARAALRLWAQ